MTRRNTLVGLLLLAIVATASPAAAEREAFTDRADDAYRMPGSSGTPPAAQVPNPLLSDPQADILEARFATVKSRRADHRSYSVTLNLAAVPDTRHAYVVAGRYGGECQLYHFITPKSEYRFANAFCGTDDDGRFSAGWISMGKVERTGTSLSATFTYKKGKLPPELRPERRLGPLFAYSCAPQEEYRVSCTTDEVLDFALTQDSFRI